MVFNKNTTKIFIISNFLLLNSSPIFSQCVYENCIELKKNRVKGTNINKIIKSERNSNINLLSHQIQSINNSFLKRILIKDNIRLDHFFDSFSSKYL